MNFFDWLYIGAIIFLIVCVGSMFAINVFKTNKPRTSATPGPNRPLEINAPTTNLPIEGCDCFDCERARMIQ